MPNNLQRPIDTAAAEKANKALNDKHPELKKRELTMDDKDAALREEWVKLYLANGGKTDETIGETIGKALDKVASFFKKAEPTPAQPCPPFKKGDDVYIVAIEILDGSDTVVLGSKGMHYVNLPGDDKWNDPPKVKNKDRQTQKPRVRVRFNKPCTETFKVKLKLGAHSAYTTNEEGRNGNFLYEKTELSFTTDPDGKKIFNDLQITSAGKDVYSYTAKDEYGHEVSSTQIETIRRIFLKELKMTGASAASSVSALISEFAKHGIEVIQLPSSTMTRIENVGTDSGPFQTAARTAYSGSDAPAKEPYVVAVAYTDHLAVKDSGDTVTKTGVEVGPGKGPVNIPILVGGRTKYLWKAIVTGESWFVSAKYRKDGETTDVDIPVGSVTAVAANSSIPDMCRAVSVDVSSIATAVETGTITLEVNTVNRMRGGLSFGGGNLICVCTRAWWQAIDAAEQVSTMSHELGHKIGMVSDDSSLDRTTNQYTAHGHVGSHCHTGVTLPSGNFDDSAISSTTCTMFGSVNGHVDFCEHCAKQVKKVDLSAGWSAF